MKTPNYDRLVQKLIFGVVTDLDLIEEVVIVGGGALAARGIRDCHDLDIICLPYAWSVLKDYYASLQPLIVPIRFDGPFSFGEKIPYEGNRMGGDSEHILIDDEIDAFDMMDVPCFSTGRMCMDAFEVMDGSERIGGLHVQGIDDLVNMKRVMGREKDRADLELLRTYLNLPVDKFEEVGAF